MNLITLITYLSLGIASAGSINITDPSSTDPFFVSTVASILLSNFQTPFSPTLISYASEAASLLGLVSDVLSTISGRLVIRLDQFSESKHVNYVLFFDGYFSFRRILQNVGIQDDPITGRCLLVYSGTQFNDKMARQIFSDLWNSRSADVDLIWNNGSRAEVWTYFPYTKPFCGSVKPLLLRSFRSNETNSHLHLFPSKTNSFKGCPLKVGSFPIAPFIIFEDDDPDELRGIEGDLLKLLAEKLDFTISIIEPANETLWGSEDGENSTGLVRLIYDEEVEFGISAMGITAGKNAFLKPGVSHHVAKLVLVVPPGREFSAFEKLFRPLAANSWATIGAYTGVAVVVITVLEFNPIPVREFVYGRGVRTPYLNLFRIMIGCEISPTPGRNFSRFLFVSWSLFGYWIRTVYLGSLFLCLQNSHSYPPMSTLEEFRSSGANLYTITPLLQMFDSFPEIMPRVRELPSKTNIMAVHIKWMLENPSVRDVLFCSTDFAARHNKLYRWTGQSIAITREMVASYTMAIYYPKRSILTDRFDYEIMRFQAAGLFTVWINRYGDYNFFQKEIINKVPDRLSNSHILGAYEIYANRIQTNGTTRPLSNMLLALLLLTFAPLHPSSQDLSHLTPLTEHSPLSEATADIISRFYTVESNQIFIRRRASDPNNVYTHRDIVNEIVLHTEPRITVQLETYRSAILNQSRKHNVFLVDDYEAFRRISEGMKIRTYDYTGYFLVIVSDSAKKGFNTVQMIMNDLWSHYILNVAVLMMYADVPKKVYYYTYFPYGKDYCEQVRPRLWKVFDGHRWTESPKNAFFPDKLKNFHSCPLKAATFDIPPFMMLQYGSDGKVASTDGLEGIVTRVLSQQLNFTVDIVVVDPPDWGITATRGMSTGASKYVRDRIVNFTIGYWSTTLDRNRYMGNTFTHYTSLITTVVPPGYPYTSLEQLLLPFKYIIWSCLVTILLIAAIVIWTLKTRSPKVQRFVFGRSTTTPLLNTVNIFLGGSLPRSPGRNFSRTLLAVWLLYGIVIRSSYTSELFNFLQLQPNKSTPRLVTDYIAQDYQIRMARNYTYVFDAFPYIIPHLRETTLQQFFAHHVDELQLPSTRYVMLMPIESAAFYNRFFVKQGKPMRVSGDRVYSSKLTIYSQRAAPVLRPFDRVLRQLISGGLIDQWASFFYQPVFLKVEHGSDEPRPMTVLQVMGCLKLLAAGLGFSVLVFGIECVVGRVKSGRRSKKSH
ncbi:uncharacterized protein LOC129761545 [Toxorhynchites rutilus septentrionalis]|uniref:uncharacterized protein LOC129761545 n=1 Tax=Toxorhynchites rutilus septentrionalis TaxID=329112 RepID=UPI00247979AB|nr:uncharacterized protein LOC129761545 [Toxorhynchites rutilus septentrionalis]